MDRRRLFELIAALSAASQLPARQTQLARPVLTREQLAAALQAAGLEFTPDQLETMLRGASRALNDYENLRKLEIPYDTEPAFAFHPGLPDRQPVAAKPIFRPTPLKAPSKPTSDEDLAFQPLTVLAALIKTRRITSTELTRLYLARLKQYGPRLLCVITLTEDLALQQAGAADSEIRRGRYRGPLHGIPYGLKDLFDTKGIPTTWGAEPFRDRVPDRDCTVYTRLQNAGAVLVAKLSMGALAMGGLWFEGMTKTPWNLKETSSGSSAGSASATGAGLVGFAIGTETRGSIVSPSIRCGTVGLRPTYGRVPRTGAMGLSWTMDKVGPICRGVEDCALVLSAIYGPDQHDRTVTAAPLHWQPTQPLSALRIGYAEAAFQKLDAETKPLYDEALETLRKAGATLKPVQIPDSSANTIGFILSAEAAAAFDDITRNGRVSELKDQGPGAWPNSFRTSRLIPAVEYIRAQRARTLLTEQFESFFQDWDAVVTPPYAHLASTNLTGHPQVVVPCGFLKGMPQGLSVISGLWREGDALRVALAYEQTAKWRLQRPKMEA